MTTMTLSIIGIGLHDADDITVKGLAAVKQADFVYLENYTSKLHCSTEDLETFYGKKLILADRKMCEDNAQAMLDRAKEKNVAFLVIGAPFAATTHIDLYMKAKQQGIAVEVIENASVLTAVGITGLFLYKFGRVTTIPLDNKDITSPYDAFVNNKEQGLHTLFLLDITPGKLMTAREGLDYLLEQGLDPEAEVIVCGALGSDQQEIIVGKASEVAVKQSPQCIIIPGDLHFTEEEALATFK